MKHVRQPALHKSLQKSSWEFLNRPPRERDGHGPDCLSHAAIDQLALGELPAAEAEGAHLHLQGCPACTTTQQAIEEDRRSFGTTTNFGALAADALARVEASRAVAPWWRRFVPILAPAGLAVAALLLVAGPRVTPAPDDQTRTKGAFGLSVYVLHAESATGTPPTGEGGLHLGEALHPGDRIRLGVRAAEASSVIVLGIDDAQVSVYHAPATAGTGAASAISGKGEELLPTAIELDETLGVETIVALRCRGNVSVATATAAAQARRAGPLGLPCDEARYVIKKVAR